MSNKTLNLTITEPGMARSLVMFRNELESQGAKAGILLRPA